MKHAFLIAALFLSTALCTAAFAEELAVIVNKENTQNVDRMMINKIYTGNLTRWPGGGNISVLELNESNDMNEHFSQKVLGKSQQKVKDLWATLVFTGKAAPPRQYPSDDEVLRAVAKNKNAIGYISAHKADATVRVVFRAN